MDTATLLGFLAAFCTTASFIPQAIRVIRTKKTRDISRGMYMFFSLGIVFWLVYGILVLSTPIIVANVVTLFFAGTILVLKFKYH